jgi:predicted site-specific integrase-resolvase
MTDEPERLLLKSEARGRLRVGPATLDRLIRRGVLPVVYLSSRAVRIRESALDALIAECERRRAR